MQLLKWLSLLEENTENIPELNVKAEVIPKQHLWFSVLAEGRTGEETDNSNTSEDDDKWCLKLAQSLQEKLQPEWRETKGKDLEELIEKKERIKTLLRKYDKTFEQRFHRPPVRHEKEPMRSLYELYRTLKSAANKSSSSPSVVVPAPREPPPKDISREQRLERLLAEKAHLGRQLQQFADNFERRHGRKVKYARDIASVQADYRLYKKLKQEIQDLRGSCFSGGE